MLIAANASKGRFQPQGPQVKIFDQVSFLKIYLDRFFTAFLVLIVFYFLEFCLFMVTAVAQKALIVMTFNKGIKAITAENPKEETVSLASETEV